MQQEIIINAITDEVRIALMENGVLTELYIEQKEKRHLTGNIYKGKVTRVLPGMQAAFVSIGLAKDAFLYVMDFRDNIERFERDEEEPFENEEEVAEEEIIPPKVNNNKNRSATIESKLKKGQEIVVQISKSPIGSKGARATSNISLPGRYLVYMPTVEHVGISRRITDPAERSRLREILKKIKPPNSGFIVRTVGEGKDEEHFRNDIQFLTNLWNQILEKSGKTSAPAILHSELDIISRSFRDTFTQDIDRVLIDSEEQFTRCVEFVNSLMPQLTNRIKLYLKPKPIFDYYNIETQIEKALKKKVWLKSGGYIVIDEAEALIAIDVNTGKYVGKDFRGNLLQN